MSVARLAADLERPERGAAGFVGEGKRRRAQEGCIRMRQNLLGLRTVRLALALTALLSVPAAVEAVPITYSGTGTILVTATVGTTTVASGLLTLTGSSSLTFDAGVPQLVSLTFSATANQGPYALTLPVPFPDYDTIVINSLTVSGGPFTTNVGSGSNPYTIAVAPLTVAGTATLDDTDNVLIPDPAGGHGLGLHDHAVRDRARHAGSGRPGGASGHPAEGRRELHRHVGAGAGHGPALRPRARLARDRTPVPARLALS
jgi:hypothetical protein